MANSAVCLSRFERNQSVTATHLFLQDIQSKVGVWHGKLDKGTTRNMSKYLTSQLPNNEQFFVDDCGHLLFFSKYDEIIRFLIVN